MTTNRAPLITAIILLLLPVLYVGSYLALVKPGGYHFMSNTGSFGSRCYFKGYRYFGAAEDNWTTEISPTVFWPLEQIDRKVRPGAWEPIHHWEPAGGGAGPIKLP